MLLRTSFLAIVLYLLTLPVLKAQDKQVIFFKIKDNGTVSAYTMKLLSADPVAEKIQLQQTFLADKTIFDWKFFPHLNQIDMEVYNTLSYSTLVSQLQSMGYTVRTE